MIFGNKVFYILYYFFFPLFFSLDLDFSNANASVLVLIHSGLPICNLCCNPAAWRSEMNLFFKAVMSNILFHCTRNTWWSGLLLTSQIVREALQTNKKTDWSSHYKSRENDPPLAQLVLWCVCVCGLLTVSKLTYYNICCVFFCLFCICLRLRF